MSSMLNALHFRPAVSGSQSEATSSRVFGIQPQGMEGCRSGNVCRYSLISSEKSVALLGDLTRWSLLLVVKMVLFERGECGPDRVTCRCSWFGVQGLTSSSPQRQRLLTQLASAMLIDDCF